MGVAYSDVPPIFAPNIDGETAAALQAGIHAAMTAAGIDSESTEDGYLYELRSDQNIACRVLIEDAGVVGGKGQLTVQFRSVDGERLGVEHPIIYDTDRIYEMQLSRTQLFLALTGYSSDEAPNGKWGLAVCGGVPYIPDLPLLCLEEPVQEQEEITEAWWSSGSDNNVLADGYGFRVSWKNKWKWDGCWQGQRVGGYASPEPSILRLAVLARPLPDWAGLSAQQTQYVNGDPLYIEPFVVWGETEGAIGRLRGQIWDAILATKDRPLEHEIVTEEFDPVTALKYGNFTWRNWMHYQGDMSHGAKGSYYSGLYLLKSITGQAGGGESNYAY